MRISILLSLFALCFCKVLPASQTINVNRQICWKGVEKNIVSDNEYVNFLYFDGAVYDGQKNGFLPLYMERFNLTSDNVKIEARLKNEIFKPLDDNEILLANSLELVQEGITITSSISHEKGQPYANIRFVPVRKNSLDGKPEKLISFELEIQITELPQSVNKKSDKKTYASHSALSSGNWYKLSIVTTGIYKISYNDLSGMSMDPSQINPKNIRIYGNGPGMLPEIDSASRYDDLQENAIWVEGENDSIFNEDDYILFYGKGPTVWAYDSVNDIFRHTVNKYSDYTYYFLTADLGAGKRLDTLYSDTATANHYVTKFNDYAYNEKELYNMIKSGKEWYGEEFNILTEYDFLFAFPNIDAGSQVTLKTSVIARSSLSSTFSVNANGNNSLMSVANIDPEQYNGDYARSSLGTLKFNTSSSDISVTVSYNKPNEDSKGWLNYLELNAVRNLTFSGNQMPFRNTECIGTGNITEYTLSNAGLSVKIWDITDPMNAGLVETTADSTDQKFRTATDDLKEYIAFNGNYFYTPTFIGKFDNQDLHGSGQYDMLIVSHPNFLSEANRLAVIHNTNDDLSVLVVTPAQIYNEFSSGAQDVTAIRDFVKMFWDRAANANEKPRYLLLFGDGSYDYKSRISSNTNYVPCFESANSLQPTVSFVTDDYFGLMDDAEGYDADGDLDVGIGRIAVQTLQEARDIVDKIARYTCKTDVNSEGTGCSSSYTNAISNFGDWKNVICFVADDEDSGLHLTQSNQVATYVDTTYKEYNIDKIFLDAYQQESTPGGHRYPDANQAINDRVEKGALIMNYTGHGGELGWAHERVLETSDINNWDNTNNMPAFVTATCEFSRFDDPERTSAGEYILLNPLGGGIALYTTTRLAYSTSNYTLVYNFYKEVFKKENGEYLKMGDLIRKSKVASGSSLYIKNFVLLGDPAVGLAYPKYKVVTTDAPDSIKALSEVTISGIIQDDSGDTVTDFNGAIYPTVFDKPTSVTTLGNDAGSPVTSFSIQKNVLYKGKASVINGVFSFSFVVPKDISYKYGDGKISYYAASDSCDASGYYEDIVIGGSDENAEPDIDGPVVQLYLNDENFRFGGITDENPLLLANISDSNGVNTTGNGIGHDIVAVLDENTYNSIVLNDYYEADLNSYQRGTVRYPFSGLSEGLHTLRLKVWDVYNNSTEAYTEFTVKSSSELTIDNVYNYPNPFSTETRFYFEHNYPCCGLDVQIQIFSITGELVKTINADVSTDGYNVQSITWNGTSDNGYKLKGMYIYRITVTDGNGGKVEKSEKLIII